MLCAVYQTGNCVVMDLAVGEDRCAIWPCEDKRLAVWKCARGDNLWGARQRGYVVFLVLRCGSR